jgi:hypothetical protein
MPLLDDNFRARQRTTAQPRFDPEPCPAPLFIGLAWAFALEMVGAAMIFGAAYLWWMVTP